MDIDEHVLPRIIRSRRGTHTNIAHESEYRRNHDFSPSSIQHPSADDLDGGKSPNSQNLIAVNKH